MSQAASPPIEWPLRNTRSVSTANRRQASRRRVQHGGVLAGGVAVLLLVLGRSSRGDHDVAAAAMAWPLRQPPVRPGAGPPVDLLLGGGARPVQRDDRRVAAIGIVFRRKLHEVARSAAAAGQPGDLQFVVARILANWCRRGVARERRGIRPAGTPSSFPSGGGPAGGRRWTDGGFTSARNSRVATGAAAAGSSGSGAGMGAGASTGGFICSSSLATSLGVAPSSERKRSKIWARVILSWALRYSRTRARTSKTESETGSFTVDESPPNSQPLTASDSFSSANRLSSSSINRNAARRPPVLALKLGVDLLANRFDPLSGRLVVDLAQEFVESLQRSVAFRFLRLVFADQLADFLQDVAGNAFRGKGLELLADEAVLARGLPQLQLVEQVSGGSAAGSPA